MKKQGNYTVNSLNVPYRKPVWLDRNEIRFEPQNMAVHKVVVPPFPQNAYLTSREIGAQLDVPPEHVRRLISEGRNEPTRLLIANDPVPFVAAEGDVTWLFETGVPSDAYADPWSLYQPYAFDERPTHGWLVRLNECEFVREPEIEVTDQPHFVGLAKEGSLCCSERDGRLIMNEGDYIEAKQEEYLGMVEPERTCFWDDAELQEMGNRIPYVQEIVRHFQSGDALPDTWIRLNLAYAIRTA